MRGRPVPQTPAEHHAEALALLNDAEEHPTHSTYRLSLLTKAATHAALALYRPSTPPRRKATAPKETAA